MKTVNDIITQATHFGSVTLIKIDKVSSTDIFKYAEFLAISAKEVKTTIYGNVATIESFTK